jgi:ABC-type nitrate/sulfonate/bicarbonate transport system ATPase subunit
MLELSNIVLRRGRHHVLDGVALRIAPGERVGLVGPSGAGKSSMLKLVAGLLQPERGTCRNGFAHTCLVFQEPRLLPWRRVRDNLTIPLRAAGYDATQARAIADDWLTRVGLSGCADAWPGQLSGGMAQRVALARAFALSPDLLLLDEPFAALDPPLRRALGALCDDALARTGAALLCVSHHPDELAERVDRCLLLEHGRLRPHPLPDPRPACTVDRSPPAAPRAQASLP